MSSVVSAEPLFAAIDAQRERIAQLETIVREALAAFKDAEWTRPKFGHGAYFCPACRNVLGRGHAGDCYIKANIVSMDALLSPLSERPEP